MKWLIGLLDFRLYATHGQWVSSGEGGQEWQPTPGGAGTPGPGPVPAPAEDAAPDFAANRQTANVDRTSSYTHAQFARQIEGANQQSRASGAAMPPQATDYELPDAAFGERLY